MLHTLQAIHDESIALLAEMERMTRSITPPPRESLSSCRLNLSRATTRRHKLLAETIYPSLRDLSPAEAARVKQLRDEDVAMMAAGSQHIREWDPERIYADWHGYRTAANLAHACLRVRLRREKMTLFPLISGTPMPLVA